MESWEKLFASGKFVECSQMLETLLNAGHAFTEGLPDIRLSFCIQHNKIVSDALCYNWFEDETNDNELHQMWSDIFTKLTNLCDTLKCHLLTSDFSLEVFLVATLNLLLWSWENLGGHFDGYLDKINQLVIFSLQSELSSCGESALETEDVLELVKLYRQCLWRIPPQRCHILFDIISLLFLHKLRFENCEQKLSRCLNILEIFCDILPQIQLHFTSGILTENDYPLFRLGPDIASSANNLNLSINLIIVVTSLYLLKLKLHDEAWKILEKDYLVKNKKLEEMVEYLKALVCLRCNDLERSLYHIECLSSMPLDAHMIKQRNILNGWLHILKGNPQRALQFLRDSNGLPEEEDQLPIHVYLMAHSYGALGQYEQQLLLLDCVVDVLREDPRYASSRVTPISSLQDRLLRCLHQQPQLSLFQSLLAAAEVSMKTSQPEKSCELLLEALRLTKCNPHHKENPCDFVKARKLQSVMRDAIVALLKCGDHTTAEILCRGLLEPAILETENHLHQAITWILYTDIQLDGPAEKNQENLFKAVQLLKKHKEVSSDGERKMSQTVIDSLIARVFYRKARLYASCGFQEDASGYFRRALALRKGTCTNIVLEVNIFYMGFGGFNAGDKHALGDANVFFNVLIDDDVILREYQRHLFMNGKNEEAGEVSDKVKAPSESTIRLEDISWESYITMDYLINGTLADRS